MINHYIPLIIHLLVYKYSERVFSSSRLRSVMNSLRGLAVGAIPVAGASAGGGRWPMGGADRLEEPKQ